MDSTPLLRADGVGKTYRRGAERVTALADVTFALEAGEMVCVTGPSGSGKTTLLNILAGWDAPDEGALRWGVPDVDPAMPDWGVLAIAPQRLGLLTELSIGENVELPLRLRSDERARLDSGAVEATLDVFGLSHLAHRMPWEVSIGEQQRTALARALVVTPRLLLADEPTGHQDAAWATGVMDGLRKSCAAGSTVVIATHDEEVIAQVPRRLDLHDGRLVGPGA